MSWHAMRLEEADPDHPGFIRRYYAVIDVFIKGSGWVWVQMDADGNRVGNASVPYSHENVAKKEAINALNGVEWES